MKSRYFDIKENATMEDLIDILQVAWPGGIVNSQFNLLKDTTKRHFITKNRDHLCELCGYMLLADDTCKNVTCKNHKKILSGMTESEKIKKFELIQKELWKMAKGEAAVHAAFAALLIRAFELASPTGEDPESA